jgi:RNA polymerase sigma-70 factor (ECF subfamily)
VIFVASAQMEGVVRKLTPAVADRAESDSAARESRLVEAARAGRVDAYERLVREYGRFAFRVAFLITREAGDAEEATQDAFVKAFRSLPRFRRGAPFRPWLLKIVANEARNRRRARTRQRLIAARVAAESPLRAFTAAAETSLLADEERRRLLDAIETLPERLRAVVTCRYLLELSEADTAAALDIRPGTVKSRLSRALERLQAELPDTARANGGSPASRLR